MKTYTQTDIETKGRLYKTAKVIASGEYVRIFKYLPDSMTFRVMTRIGLQDFNWRELSDYCL